MSKIVLFVSFVLSFLSCNALPHKSDSTMCKACDIKLVKDTEKEINNISNIQLEKFLCTFKNECLTNSEYIEFSNEILYKILQMNPSLFIQVLSESQKIDKDFILNQISNPILDYDFKQIIRSLKESKGDLTTKKLIIKALNNKKVP